MPLFTISEVTHDLHRRAVLLDTNVVYAAFSPSDSRHGDTVAYLELEEQFVLTLPVIVETWGLLVGRDRDWTAGLKFLRWIDDPSSGVVVVNHAENMTTVQAVAASAHVDCVDATILLLADQITRQCGYAPWFRVATYDTRDFWRSLKAAKLRFTLVDLNSLDEIELSE
jgi:predicted nucleic acid-binding protein